MSNLLIGYIVLSYIVIIVNALVRSKELKDDTEIPVSSVISYIVLAPLTFPIIVLYWIINIFQ